MQAIFNTGASFGAARSGRDVRPLPPRRWQDLADHCPACHSWRDLGKRRLPAMDSIWMIIVSVIVIVAAASTIRALLAERAPRIPVDAEPFARLRDRAADDIARQRIGAEERLALERDARTLSPQRRLRTDRGSAERLWAGGL
jgi:hypothetical protein